MQTTYLNNQKVAVFRGNCYRLTEESKTAIVQAEWAEQKLNEPCVYWDNGNNSHDAALETLDRTDDVLLDHLLVAV